MSVTALSRLLEAIAKSIKHATAMSTLLTTEIFQARGLSLHGLTVRNVPKSVDIFKTDGRYSSVPTPTCHISLSIPRRLADQRSDSQPFDLSDKILHTNYSKSRFPAKSKEIGSVSLSEIHLYRHGISDAAKFSQGSNGLCTEPTSDSKQFCHSNMYRHELSFLFWANSVLQQILFS